MLDDRRLADAEARSRPYKLADERSLYVLVSPTGAKSFRWKYRFAGREQLLTLGRYPDISLNEARRRAALARQQLYDGRNPSRVHMVDSPVSIEDLAELPLPSDGARVIYFIQTPSGFIKIGTTANLDVRMRSLQTAHPEPLAVLAALPGGHSHEATLHRIFAEHRDHGEWFSPSPALLTLIDKIVQGGRWPC